MLRFFNSDSVNVEHQLAAKHIIRLLASNGTLHVLHYLCARAVNINEIGCVYGVVLYANLLIHRLSLGDETDVLLPNAVLLAEVDSLFLGGEIVAERLRGVNKPLTYLSVLNLLILDLGRYQLLLHLTAQLLDLAGTFQHLKLYPPFVLLLAVVFLYRGEIDTVLLAVELCVMLRAESVLTAWHDVYLLVAELVSL